MVHARRQIPIPGRESNSNTDGNGYGDGNSYAYSDGATTDNTYTTAPSNAAAAPVALTGIVKA